MRIGKFEFNRRELAGSMGDFGTLFPLAIGYIVVCGMNPAGFLVMMGLTNIVTGLVYKLPMPVQPKKVIAVTAIAQRWPSSLIYASGFGTGVIWLFLAVTGWIQKVADRTPKSVVRGIQITLGVMLSLQGLKMMRDDWILAAIAVTLILTLRESKYAPATIVLMVLGTTIAGYRGELLKVLHFHFELPPITGFALREIYQGLLLGGFAQIPLTATNAVIATVALIKEYWPDSSVSERKLALNMGILNTVVVFFGGMPMCHGAGGLAGQYYFGARTGGANIIEGTIEIGLGLFLSKTIVDLFSAFPLSIVGAMMCMVGLNLVRYALTLRVKDIAPATVTASVSLLLNIALGFATGVAIYFLIKYCFRAAGRCRRCRRESRLLTLTPDSKM